MLIVGYTIFMLLPFICTLGPHITKFLLPNGNYVAYTDVYVQQQTFAVITYIGGRIEKILFRYM